MANKQKNSAPDEHSPGILIADDNLAILKYLEAMLSSFGYKTTTAIDGAEALKLFNKDVHSIVLTDIEMPRMNGFQLLEEIKKISHETPVIVMTGYINDYDKQNILEAGGSDFLHKPFSKTKLVNLLCGQKKTIEKKNYSLTNDALAQNLNTQKSSQVDIPI